MIKDFVFKLLFIPLTGIFIPVFSGLIHYSNFTTTQLIFSNLFFIISWYVTWQGSIFIIAHLRNRKVLSDIFLQLIFLCGTTALFTTLLATLSALLWQGAYLRHLVVHPIYNYAILCACFSIFITLIYEVLFLKKEVELDTKIVDQLDQERQHAEMNVLKNELDPHFIFNSLTALSHLINNNTEKAKLFTQKLAQAYKYLLINKDREMISLEEELRFIDNYFFLLQIRHDDKLKLHVDIDESRNSRVMILPCALQILIENAIKHNQFTEADPLVINIWLNGFFLHVSNNVQSKPYRVESTNIGLKNLSTRYKLTCNKDIVVNRAKEKFIVKLPIIQ